MTDSERQRCISRLPFPPALERTFQEDYYQHARTTMRIGCAVFTLLMLLKGRGTVEAYFMEGEHVPAQTPLPALEAGGRGSSRPAAPEDPAQVGRKGGQP